MRKNKIKNIRLVIDINAIDDSGIFGNYTFLNQEKYL